MPFPPSSDWHLRPAAEVLQAQQTDAARGLSAEEAARRLQEHGTNELATQQARPWPKLLLEQFTDFMILVLLAAAVVSGLLGEWVDTLVIVVIVVLNAVIGFTQARRADQAIAALRQLAAAQAQVLRGGQPQPVPAADLVPGDIVLLEAGNQIPADLRLLEAAQLKVDESTLTGESVTVEKRTEALVGDKLALGDRINLGFKGTTVTHGRARRGGGHRHGHRAGQRGRPAERRHGPRHAAAIAAGALFKAVVADRAADLRGVVRLWPTARRAGHGDAAHRHQPGRGGHPRGPARRGHRAAGRGRAPHGRLQRADPPPVGRGNAGLGQRDPDQTRLHAAQLWIALQMATIYVPWLNPIVKTQPLAAWELGLCVALAALVFVAVELEKAWRRQRMRAGAWPA